MTVNLAKDGKTTACRIHRLVLEAFVGLCPEGMVACHNDGDRSNNELANLRWDTPKANSEDSLRHGTRAIGSRCNAKLTDQDVPEIRRLRPQGEQRTSVQDSGGLLSPDISARHPGNGSVVDRYGGYVPVHQLVAKYES